MATHNYIDIGVNLCSPQFCNREEEILKNAKNANIHLIVCISNSIKECPSNIRMCRKFRAPSYPRMYCTIGVHPHSAKQCNSHNFLLLEKLITKNSECVVAIGECGLDYHRMFSSQNAQRKWFEEQVHLARKLDLPLFLHERKAHDDFVEILSKYDGLRGVVHCFTSSQKALERYLAMGFYIGITGYICNDKRAADLQKCIRLIPLDRLLIETDAPYMPVGNSKVNEPQHVTAVYRKLSILFGVSEDNLMQQVQKNFDCLFRRK
jgi:TatD DNase family protein